MKAPARLFLPLLVILFCCNKPHETTRTPTPPQQLTTNVTSVSLSGNLNARDSVAVQSNGKWTLNVSPASATWLTPSTTAGNGNTTVYLTANAENKSGADRTATVVITPESATTQPVSLTVTQRPYTLSFTAAWSKLYGGTKGDIFNSVVRSPDGGYIAVGYTQSSDGDVTGFKGANDAWAIKVDAAGNKVWTKTYGGSAGDIFSWITPATDGGYIIAGATTSSDGDVSGQHG
ncbi:MAG: BACON domain-containing protein, partial [Bacteroidota bacterium]|nr:BACON domain-containing protein [Bacteroidota bacterium]